MKKIRTLIVDDEPVARNGLELLLSRDTEIELIGSAPDGKLGLERIRTEEPDLIFLDIELPELDGFGVLDELAPAEKPHVVFVSAHEHHAVRAFDVAAVDYLLKPYSRARFATALSRAKQAVRRAREASLSQRVQELLDQVNRLEAPASGATRIPILNSDSSPEYADRIVLKSDGALHFIKSRDVIWIEAQGDFVKVQTLAKSQMVRETLQSMERKLDTAQFLRIHRSYLVNLEHVKRIETALYGDYSVHMSDGTKLRLSRNYRPKLKELIRQGSLGVSRSERAL